MKYISTSLLFALALVLAGCSRPSERQLLSEGQEAFEQGKPEEALSIYGRYFRDYPRGTEKAEALYAAGVIYQNARGDLPTAIRYYREVADSFPDHPRAPGALFLVGFIYSNELKNLDSARVAYEEFLKRYPQDPMAPSARFELANLGIEPGLLLVPDQQKDQATTKKRRARAN